MKTVTRAGSVIWNENHPLLKPFGDGLITVKGPVTEELFERIGEDRNVCVLCDNDPSSLELFSALAEKYHSRRIHLFACLPFTYESARRKKAVLEALGDLSKVKSLCLIRLDDYLAGSDNGETLGSLQLRIRNGCALLLSTAAPLTESLDEFIQYVYDEKAGEYVPEDPEEVIRKEKDLLSGKKTEIPEPEVIPEELREEVVEEQEEEEREEEVKVPEPDPAERELPEEPETVPKKKRGLFSFFRRK